MSIYVSCPNGHQLTAKESKAGTIGKCPACGAPVKIPEPKSKVTDSSVLRILGIGEILRNASNFSNEDIFDTESTKKEKPKGEVQKTKVCPQCDWEIDAAYKICPHCRYYFMPK